MDHFIKEKLGCRYYLRYMDDFAVLHDDKEFLWEVKKRIQAYLGTLRLKLHEGKCRIFETEKGMPFLGLVISAKTRRLKRGNVIKFKRRMKKFQDFYSQNKIEWKQINQSVQAWIGHSKHGNTMQLRKLIFPEIAFRKGKVVEGD